MKVVHLAFNHRYDDIRIFEKECVSLAKQGYEVVYITSSNNSPALGKIRKKGITIIVVPVNTAETFYIRLIKFWIRACKLAYQQNADVYHIHEVWFLPMISLLRRKGNVIYDSHEDAPRDHFERQKDRRTTGTRIAERLFEMYENSRVRNTSGVIAATPYIARRFQKIHKNVVIIANYPLIENLKTGNGIQKENVILKNPLDAERVNGPFICYAGGISPERGIGQLVRAMESIDARLLIAGKVENGYKEKLLQIRGAEKCIFLGYLEREDIAELYSRCVIGCCTLLNVPNTYHSLPIKMFEYMASAMPVVASDFPLWKNILEKNGCGICVDPQDSKQIAKAVNRLLRDQKLCEEMGRNGRKMIEKKCRWDKEEKKLAEFYERIQNSKLNAGGNRRKRHYECADYCKRHS